MTVEGGPDSQGFPVGGPVADTRKPGKDPLKLEGIDLSGASAASVSWIGDTVEGPGHAIAAVTLSQPVAPSTMLIVRVAVADGGEKRTGCGHRRAFANVFPIGVWQSDEEILPAPDSMRIDTGVAPGGAKKTDKFFTDLTP